MIADPRPDLETDSRAWCQLLTLAQGNEMLAGLLHGFRCGGMRLIKGQRGWIMRPEFNPLTSVWTSNDHYAKDREQWLMPHGAEITALLDKLGGVA